MAAFDASRVEPKGPQFGLAAGQAGTHSSAGGVGIEVKSLRARRTFSPTERLRCGVVGVGRMGQHHARVYSKLPHCELVGVVDASPIRAQEIADKFETRALASVHDLLALGVDAVSIAVPTTCHRMEAEPLLRAGVACLIEKPLAQDAATAQAIKEAADASGACLMVGHIERFNPIMRAMQRATSTGQPVVPRFIEVHRVSPMTFRSVDVGVVMDMMIHDLDVVVMLMGGHEPDEIQAAGVNVITDYEDMCNARLTFHRPEGTCVANVSASRLALKTERVTRITGQNAYIKIDYAARTGYMVRRVANESQMLEMREQIRGGRDLTSLRWQELVNYEPLEVTDDDGEPIVMEIQAFLEAVRTGSRPPIDAEAGFANVRTAQRIVEAIRETMGLELPMPMV
ncbi:MAG: Gfo/Idh/MocA family oxidoreductase [Planctomycetota bacterium]|nr:Gfo/Idh/MocA family oxidoreductase [Planctomycetota bacterium]